ncbi:glycosyl transferase family 41-domain-containing protein [Baffinella frigidus]|nr:glycosyl transferase family 41-domain-containing protein [Cryptophyta sp. CCMP2293]
MLVDSLFAAAERIRVEEKAPTRALPVYEVLCQAHGGRTPMTATALVLCGTIRMDELNDLDRANALFDMALQIEPRNARALNNKGLAAMRVYKLVSAGELFNKAIEVDPTSPSAYNNLGLCYQMIGDIPAALDAYERCLVACGYMEKAATNKLLCLNYSTEHSRDECSDAHFADPARRIRIGYLSADYCDHPVAYFFEAVLAHRDREGTHVTLYYGGKQQDAVTAQFKSLADDFQNVDLLNAEEVAARIHSDGIDILVELSGYTTLAPVAIPAAVMHPAPIQVSWIGYPNTTGLDAIHYRFTDAIADPPASTQRYAETLVRLPHCFLCYTPPAHMPQLADAPPCVSNGYITFGSFNNISKEARALDRGGE